MRIFLPDDAMCANERISVSCCEDAPEGHLSAAAPSVLLDEPEDIQFVDRDHVGRMPVGMVLPTGALIAVGLTLSVMAGPIFAYANRAADEVLDREQYITAVVGDRWR